MRKVPDVMRRSILFAGIWSGPGRCFSILSQLMTEWSGSSRDVTCGSFDLACRLSERLSGTEHGDPAITVTEGNPSWRTSFICL